MSVLPKFSATSLTPKSGKTQYVGAGKTQYVGPGKTQLIGRMGMLAALAMGFAIGFMSTTTMAKAEAAAQSDEERYTACMALIDRNAQDAFDMADKWSFMGGGDPAKHCAAAALLALGFAEDAAGRLETLAKTSVQKDAFRAEIYKQAGAAWAEAKNWDRANAVQSAAITLAPDTMAYYVDRARTRAQSENYGLAVDDLTHVLDKEPKNVEALILRASAYRYLDTNALALDDINAALQLEPENPQALLERGILYRLSDQPNKARADWVTALVQVDEASAVAAKIRRNIELLEFPDPK